MSGNKGFGMRPNGGDGYHNPQGTRRYNYNYEPQSPPLQPRPNYQFHQHFQQFQNFQFEQFQRPVWPALPSNTVVQYQVESGSSTLLSTLDRIMESVTPVVPARLPEAGVKGKRKEGDTSGAYFNLGDLWKSYEEWSAYGAGVPLVLKEGDPPVTQYYIPFLSGIQLYIDPSNSSSGLRKSHEESGAESARAAGSAESSGCEADRRLQGVAAGEWSTPLNLNAQMNRLSLRNEAEKSNSPGMLIYEHLENNSPWSRPPLFDKVLALASQVPELNIYKSSDLLPASWLCVAWYPIYRIPLGQTLEELEASFLTFHHLSTQSKSQNVDQPHDQKHSQFSTASGSSEDDLQQPSDVNMPNKNKHHLKNPSDSLQSKKAESADEGVASAFGEMATTVSSLTDTEKDGGILSSFFAGSVIEVVQALPEMDEDLVLDACDLLEDEKKKAKIFLALDVQLRKKWLIR